MRRRHAADAGGRSPAAGTLHPARRGRPHASLGHRGAGMTAGPLLSVTGLTKEFEVGRDLFGRPLRHLRAVDSVTLDVMPGETLGIVGESGCGKTTLGRMMMRLIEPSAGRIAFDGRDFTHLSRGALRPLRGEMQIVFQDPFSSLNPRMTVRDIIAEPLENAGLGRRAIR